MGNFALDQYRSSTGWRNHKKSYFVLSIALTPPPLLNFERREYGHD